MNLRWLRASLALGRKLDRDLFSANGERTQGACKGRWCIESGKLSRIPPDGSGQGRRRGRPFLPSTAAPRPPSARRPAPASRSAGRARAREGAGAGAGKGPPRGPRSPAAGGAGCDPQSPPRGRSLRPSLRSGRPADCGRGLRPRRPASPRAFPGRPGPAPRAPLRSGPASAPSGPARCRRAARAPHPDASGDGARRRPAGQASGVAGLRAGGAGGRGPRGCGRAPSSGQRRDYSSQQPEPAARPAGPLGAVVRPLGGAPGPRPRGDLPSFLSSFLPSFSPAGARSFHLVGISFFILGLGTLLPWNFFITAIPYFQGRLAGANISTTEAGTNHTGTVDSFNFNNWVTLLSQLPLLLFTLLNSFLYQCIPEAVRILGSLLAILFLFALTAALVKVDMDPAPFFSITMASVWFINSFCAILQGGLFGQLGTMPSAYSTLFLSGQGLAGIFAALAMLLSMASGVDAQTSALGYFITPCVGILLSIVCYLSLPHLEFARYYLARRPVQAPAQELETKAELLQADEKNGIPVSPHKATLTLELDLEKELEPEPEPEPEEAEKPEKPSVFLVFRKIWLTALCLVLVFTVTLSVFPAITAMVTSSTSPGKWSQFFNPICCFLLFNVMDWLGRSLTSYFLWPDGDSRLLPLLVCLRVLFVPLFMLCHVPERSRLPVLFPQDAYFITFMLLFAVSNGYLVSLTMCLAPRQVLPHEREVAGALMTFFLALGLSCGASLSFLFKALL
ncbi:equilibrative nucleoside transporter 2 [Suncus etruscus]|uniref:equilibrative nucleoside transporter 2 n=1 Tax=Suncus etruscus TaxID=109475 RepID=UPI00210FC243|nr:equilibrative nucleoside transporter 2 [Suncus etruscus]